MRRMPTRTSAGPRCGSGRSSIVSSPGLRHTTARMISPSFDEVRFSYADPQGSDAGLLPLLQIVEVNHKRDEQTLQYHLPERIDPQQDSRVAHGLKQNGADDGSEHGSAAPEQACSSDDGRGNRLKLVGIGHGGRGNAQPRHQKDAAQSGE